MDSGPREVTQLLAKLSAGDSEASSRLIVLVYAELRAMAGRCMRHERPNHTCRPRSWCMKPICGWRGRMRFSGKIGLIFLGSRQG